MFPMSGSMLVDARRPDSEAPLSSRLKIVSELPVVIGRETFAHPVLKGPASGNLKIEIYDDLCAAASEWRAFERHADCTPFQLFGWLEKWQLHIGARKDTVPVVVFAREANGEVLFVLPLAIQKRSAFRRLTWLGVDLGDYNAPLLSARFADHPAAENFAAVWNAIVSLLGTDARFQFDLADLAKMPETVGAQNNPFLSLKVLPNRSGAYIATLGSNWDDYYAAARSASTRKTARRKQKQLESHGVVRFAEAVGADDSAQTLITLMEQKSNTFIQMGVENIFLRPGYRDFYRAIATDEKLREVVHVSRLEVGEMIGATSVALRLRGRYYLILSSYHGGDISRFGPGTTHLHELMRNAIERGFGQFDFTIGDELYKLDWADIKLTLYDHVAAYTLRGWIVASWATLLRRMTRFIKQTPALWRFAVKVRSMLGGRGHSGAAPAE